MLLEKSSDADLLYSLRQLVTQESRMTASTKTITTTLPLDELAALDRVRSRESRSRAALVREAIQWYLAAVDRLPPAEDPLRSETEALREAEEEFARGQGRRLEDVLRDLGRPAG